MQTGLAALIVLACAAYAAWALMPAAARRALAAALLRLPLPGAFTARLRRAAAAKSGCGCDGCDRAQPKAAAPATVTFHPRRPR